MIEFRGFQIPNLEAEAILELEREYDINIELTENPIKFPNKCATVKSNNITQLFLHRCEIKDLIQSILNLKKLSYIQLTKNFFEVFPGFLKNMEHLKEFIFFRNNLKEIPNSLFEFENLIEINLNFNNPSS